MTIDPTVLSAPSPNGENGRDAGGRFAKGNPGGPGNPYAKRVGELRSAMLGALSDDDWRDIMATLIAQAKAGESWAIREVLDRTLGKPSEMDLIARIEELEQSAAAITGRN